MCKSKKQKNKSNLQLELFSKQARKPSQGSTGGTSTGPVKGAELFSRLKSQRTLTKTILEKIVDYENLSRAYKQVASNGGSGGVDRMDIEDLRQWLGKNIDNMREKILTEQYEVSPVRKVEISKGTGGTRMLGIPTVKDRLIQQAIHQELNRYYEPHFSESSYGFRPGRDAHQAILQASEYIKEGREGC
ncbi:MAG: reverse transcriptase domain-containing protein [Fulvivirga sp.]